MPSTLQDFGRVFLAREDGAFVIYVKREASRQPLLLARCLSQSTAVHTWLRLAASEARH